MTRTVWVTWNGLVKVAEGIGLWEEGLVLDGHPAIERYPDALEELGTVGDDTASRIVMSGNRATFKVFSKDITPKGTQPLAEEPALRGRGRPRGTRLVTRKQIVDTNRSLRASYGRGPTQAELAASLNPRIEVRTLQDTLTDYRLPWPLPE